MSENFGNCNLMWNFIYLKWKFSRDIRIFLSFFQFHKESNGSSSSESWTTSQRSGSHSPIKNVINQKSPKQTSKNLRHSKHWSLHQLMKYLFSVSSTCHKKFISSSWQRNASCQILFYMHKNPRYFIAWIVRNKIHSVRIFI